MKKSICAVLIASMLATTMAGCGSPTASDSSGSEAKTASSDSTSIEAENQSTSDSEGDQVTVSVWGWNNAAYNQIFAKYHEEHPNVNIETVDVEWGDMLTKTQQALASGSELPTLLMLDSSLMGSWKEMNVLEDLRKYGFDTTGYNQSLIDASTDADGKLIAYTTALCPAGMVYKRDLAKKYLGTDDPDEIQAMLTSVDDYAELGKKVHDESNGSVYLFHSAQAVAEWLYFASDVPNMKDDTTINMTEKMADVLGGLKKLCDAGCVDSYQNGTPEANATYADDTHIFYPCPDWAVAYYIVPNAPDSVGNWGMIKMPKSYSHAGGGGFGIATSASDAEKQAAYDLLHWMISEEEGAKVSFEVTGTVTADPTISSEDSFAERYPYKDLFAGEDVYKLLYEIGRAHV